LEQALDYGFSVEVLDTVIGLLFKNDNKVRSGRVVKNINALFKTYRDIDLIEIKSRVWIIKTASALIVQGVTLPEVLRLKCGETAGANDHIRDILKQTEELSARLTSADCKVIAATVDDRLRYRKIVNMRDSLVDAIDNAISGGVRSFNDQSKALYNSANKIIQAKRDITSFEDGRQYDISNTDSVNSICDEIITENTTSDRCFRTGIKMLNKWLAPGLLGEKFYMFITPPNQGKTNILTEIAKDIKMFNEPLKPRKPGMVPTVLHIVMEDTEKDIFKRMFSLVTGKNISDFGNKAAITRELRDNGFMFDEDHNINIVVKYHEYRSISTDDIYTIVKEMEDNGQEVIAILQDYVKRIEPSVPDPKNEKGEIHRICNEMKTISSKLGVPVCSAMQLNREAMSIIDTAKEKGQGDLAKKVGRTHVGVAIEVIEVPDVCVLMDREDLICPTESPYWPTWQTFKLLRHRYNADYLINGKNYFAHPFDKRMAIKYICDADDEESVSRDSLVTALVQEDKKKTIKTDKDVLDYIAGKYEEL
jgi:replicative DNA helicase